MHAVPRESEIANAAVAARKRKEVAEDALRELLATIERELAPLRRRFDQLDEALRNDLKWLELRAKRIRKHLEGT
jgi:hypothetical protein